MKKFDHGQVEGFARQYWASNGIYGRIKQRNRGAQPFAFLDGPPYTSGKVHLGTAWNKSLKDMTLRIKRMQGFDTYDRAGYDMHGLPTEHATMKKLGLHTNEDIERYGIERFIQACKEWCTTNMREMNKEFEQLGVWMDFDNAYQTISPSYIDGIWMLIKRAHENGRFYEGLRTMAWDPVFETACAKHELTYETVTDNSIYVKFPVLDGGKETDRFLVIWTTTPWTIPLNMAVMVNPSVEYAEARVGNESWIVASALADTFIGGVCQEEFAVQRTFPGSELAGVQYRHPLTDRMPYAELKGKHPKIHTVVLSSEYVDTSAGTGLVHCAPGCGPEDYEVGIANDLPIFNFVAPDGSFPQPFKGWKARVDDDKFTAAIEDAGALVAKQKVKHEYPHSERSKAPIIYRATSQWFFKVSDLKERMVGANNTVQWQPEAGYNAFTSWLENLRDNSVTKQRYWGTPLPVWRNKDTGETIVVGSLAELERLSGQAVKDPHKPYIDSVFIPSQKHPGTALVRLPDVLDVWVDAGSASWNALDYPRNEKLIKTHYPADFILEGKDQIRGWFNLLLIAGFLAFNEKSFKRVYMHGFINDAQGRKMSKSLGNYITPQEVLPKYGVDAFRAYMIGGTAPGLDINYNMEDLTTTYKNLNVLWNTVQYLVDLCRNSDLVPRPASGGDEEEQYILSRMESVTAAASAAVDNYNLPEVPRLVEAFFLEVSRTYIQLVREKAGGEPEERQLVADTLCTVLQRALVLLAPVAPFVTEVLWQDLNELTGASGSVHEQPWPSVNDALMQRELEEHFSTVQQIITAAFSCRERLKQGVRWPLKELVIDTDLPLQRYEDMIRRQVNVKAVSWEKVSGELEAAPNYGALGKSFGKDTQKVAAIIQRQQRRPPYTVDGYTILDEHVKVTVKPLEGYERAGFPGGEVYLSTEVTPELLEEGFARELTRRVQALRKDLGLQKRDGIQLHIGGKHALSKHHLEELARRANAVLVATPLKERRDEHIRDRTYAISAQKTI